MSVSYHTNIKRHRYRGIIFLLTFPRVACTHDVRRRSRQHSCVGFSCVPRLQRRRARREPRLVLIRRIYWNRHPLTFIILYFKNGGVTRDDISALLGQKLLNQISVKDICLKNLTTGFTKNMLAPLVGCGGQMAVWRRECLYLMWRRGTSQNSVGTDPDSDRWKCQKELWQLSLKLKQVTQKDNFRRHKGQFLRGYLII